MPAPKKTSVEPKAPKKPIEKPEREDGETPIPVVPTPGTKK